MLNKCQACPFTGGKNHCHSRFTVSPFVLDCLSLTHLCIFPALQTDDILVPLNTCHFTSLDVHCMVLTSKHLPSFKRDTFTYTGLVLSGSLYSTGNTGSCWRALTSQARAKPLWVKVISPFPGISWGLFCFVFLRRSL